MTHWHCGALGMRDDVLYAMKHDALALSEVGRGDDVSYRTERGGSTYTMRLTKTIHAMRLRRRQ
jgi:hypothetical protein